MSDKIVYKFGDVSSTPHEIIEEIESRGYKKAVKSFQNKFPKLKYRRNMAWTYHWIK